jgi:hypothetical protein
MIQSIQPEYVDYIPKTLDEGVLYISRKFRTASHLCCCGCGTKIVTPLRETEYRLLENHDMVSLYPSIGNWNHPCQSHYWIRNSAVLWSGQMTRAEIDFGRLHDDAQKEAYFSTVARPWWRRAISYLTRWMTSLFK